MLSTSKFVIISVSTLAFFSKHNRKISIDPRNNFCKSAPFSDSMLTNSKQALRSELSRKAQKLITTDLSTIPNILRACDSVISEEFS